MTKERLLGIDYGEKRVGLAVSDEAGQIAFPKKVVPNNPKLIQNIQDLIRENNIRGVVVGESLDFKGKPNQIAKRAEEFIEELSKKLDINIFRQSEFLTTVEARKRGRGKEILAAQGAHSKIKKENPGRADAGAAALILQRYLDKKNKLINND